MPLDYGDNISRFGGAGFGDKVDGVLVDVWASVSEGALLIDENYDTWGDTAWGARSKGTVILNDDFDSGWP